jgi:hypothetical protein
VKNSTAEEKEQSWRTTVKLENNSKAIEQL